jgi:hypothetical protein
MDKKDRNEIKGSKPRKRESKGENKQIIPHHHHHPPTRHEQPKERKKKFNFKE